MFIGKYKAEGKKLEMTSARAPTSPLIGYAIKILLVIGLLLLAAGCQRFHVKAIKSGAATFCMGLSSIAAAILFHCCRKPAQVVHFSKPAPREIKNSSIALEHGKSRMEGQGYSFWIDSMPGKPSKHDVILSSNQSDFAVEYGAQLICPDSLVPGHFAKTHVTGLAPWKTKSLENGITITAAETGCDDCYAWVITERDQHSYFPGNQTLWSDEPIFNVLRAHFPKLHRLVLPTNLSNHKSLAEAVAMIKLLDPDEIIIQTEGGNVEERDSATMGSWEFILLPTGQLGRFGYATKVGNQITYTPGPHTLAEGDHIAKIKKRLGAIDCMVGTPLAGLQMKANPERSEVNFDDSKWPKLNTLAAKAAFLMFHGLGDKLRYNI